MRLQRTDSQETNGSGDGTASIDQTSDSSQTLVVSTDRRVRSQVGSDSGSNNVVGSETRERKCQQMSQANKFSTSEEMYCNLPSDKDTHASKKDQKSNGVHSGFRLGGKDTQENNEGTHERSNDHGAASSKVIRDVSDNDTTGHHTDRVQQGNQVGSDIIKVNLTQKVREPEEKDIVGKLEETKGQSVLSHHGNLEGTEVGNGLGAFVFGHGFSLFGQFLSLGFELFLSNLDFGGNDSDIERIGNELSSQKGPSNVTEGRNGQGPPVGHFQRQNDGSTKSGSNVSQVLMARPESENGT